MLYIVLLLQYFYILVCSMVLFIFCPFNTSSSKLYYCCQSFHNSLRCYCSNIVVLLFVIHMIALLNLLLISSLLIQFKYITFNCVIINSYLSPCIFIPSAVQADVFSVTRNIWSYSHSYRRPTLYISSQLQRKLLSFQRTRFVYQLHFITCTLTFK